MLASHFLGTRLCGFRLLHRGRCCFLAAVDHRARDLVGPVLVPVVDAVEADVDEQAAGLVRRAAVGLLDAERAVGAAEQEIAIHAATLPTGLELITALARIDGSVGWTALIGNGSDLFAALLPRKTYDQIYQDGPDVIVAGSVTPAGTAVRAADSGLKCQ